MDTQISGPIPGPMTPPNASKTHSANGDMDTLGSIAVSKRTNLNKENLDPGMFARERNPRRKATKLFGDVPTPPPPRRPKSVPTPASNPQSVVKSVRSKKRKPQQDYHWPSEKRRRKSKHSNPRYSPQCEVVANVTPAMTDQIDDLVSGRSEGKQSPEPLQSLSGLLTPSTEVAEHRPTRPVPAITLAVLQQTDSPELPMPVPVPEDLPQTVSPPRSEPDPPSHLANVPKPGPMPELFEASVPFPQAASSEFLGLLPHPAGSCSSEPLPQPQSSHPSMPLARITELQESNQFQRPETLQHTFQNCSKAQLLPVVQEPVDPTHDLDSAFHPINFDPLKRPVRDTNAIIDYVEAVKTVLRGQSVVEPCTVATRQARRILSLLEAGKPPDATDAAFVNSLEAAEYLSSQWDGVIVTEGQQVFPLQTVQEFLGEYYNIRAKVWVQDPSVQIARNLPSVKQATIAQVKKRFATRLRPGDEPWNLLELATHCDDGLRPVFLNNEDCRLLTKLKIPNSAREAKRRAYSPGYKEVEKWALVAQAGALTEPHQDSHGYGTFITLNSGFIGFGWLSRPTDADRAEWCASPSTYLGDRWRYMVLKPGQTVYFPAGTVHFVFRLPAAGDSLAFGGHVLRCSNLVRWVQTLLEEKRYPAITNEDITQSAPGYLNQVEKFVKQALQSGDIARMSKWGGRAAIEEFLRLKKEFMDA